MKQWILGWHDCGLFRELGNSKTCREREVSSRTGRALGHTKMQVVNFWVWVSCCWCQSPPWTPAILHLSTAVALQKVPSFGTLWLSYLSSPYKAHLVAFFNSLPGTVPSIQTGYFQSKREPHGFFIIPQLLLCCYPPRPPTPFQAHAAYHYHLGSLVVSSLSTKEP